jgi:GDP-L-fucose synthase
MAKSRNETVLVTGASGLLGRSLVNLISGMESWEHTNVLTPSREELDLGNPLSVNAYFQQNRPTTVLHLAAKVMGLSGNLTFQRDSMEANLSINENLFRACLQTPPRVVFFAGTAASYAFPYASLPLDESQFLAGDVHAGEFGYAWAKRMAYPWLRLLGEEANVAWVYGIITNLFGPEDRFLGDFTHVIPALIHRGAEVGGTHRKKALRVWGHPTVTRDFLFAPEAARAILHAIEFASISGSFVNIASGQEISMGRVANIVAQNFDLKGVEWLSKMPVGVPRRVMNVSKLEGIGFRPSLNFEDQISETISWYMANRRRLR